MNIFKSDPKKKLNKLKIRLAGLEIKEETSHAVIKSASSTPMYFIEDFIKLRQEIGELRKEIELLEI